MMPEFSFKIDLGHLLILVGMLLGGAIGWGNLSTQLGEHAKAFDEMRAEIKLVREKLDSVREQQVKTQTQLDERLRQGSR